jgi:C-terminus of histone H2A
MQLVITRNNVLSLVIFNWPLGTTKSRGFLFSLFLFFTESGCRLCRLLGDVVISQGGVVPHIAPVRRCITIEKGNHLIHCFQELLPGKSRYTIFSILLLGIMANYSISKSKKDAEEA